MDSRDIKGNIGFRNFDNLSKKIHAITQRKFGHLVNIVPNKIENKPDLKNINTAMSRSGLSPQDLYEDTKNLLMSIDEEIERATNVEMNKIEFSFEAGSFYSPTEVAGKLVDIARENDYDQARISGNEPTIGRSHLLSVLMSLKIPVFGSYWKLTES